MEGHINSGSSANLVTGNNFESEMNILAEAMVAAQDIGKPKAMREAMNSPKSAQWKEAVQSKYDSLMRNETWKLTPLPPGRKTVSNKWLFKCKLNPDGTIARFKAMLVV